MRKNEWGRLEAGQIVMVRRSGGPAARMTPVKVLNPIPREGTVWSHSYERGSRDRIAHLVEIRPLDGLSSDTRGVYMAEQVWGPDKAFPVTVRLRSLAERIEGETLVVDVQQIESPWATETARSFWGSEREYREWAAEGEAAAKAAADRRQAIRRRAESIARGGYESGPMRWRMDTKTSAQVEDVEAFVEWFRTLTSIEQAHVVVRFEVLARPDLLRPVCPVCEGAKCPECDHQGFQLLADEGDE